jgi:hypothetical protein
MRWNPERILVYQNAEATAGSSVQSSNLSRKQRIGIWDLDATAGSLPQILDVIEEQQTYFSFYCVEAAFQMGLTIPGASVAREWHERTGHTMYSADAALNVSAGPIFTAAKPILNALPIDWLVVVVKSMISDATDLNDSWYNLFSTSKHRIVLISTFELREYAAQARRPFEAAVVGSALSALLATMVPKIKYQRDVSTGSIFDFCQNRSDIVKSLRNPTIDPANRARIPSELLEPTERILNALISYKGSVTPAQIRRQLTVSARRTDSKIRNIGTPVSLTKMTAGAQLPPQHTPQPGISFKDILKQLHESLPKSSPKRPVGSKKTPKGSGGKRGR